MKALFALVLLPAVMGFSLAPLGGVGQLALRGVSRSAAISALKMAEEKNGEQPKVDRRAVLGGLFTLLVTGPLAFPNDAEAVRSGGRVSSGGIRSRVAAPRARVAAPAAARPSVTVVQPTIIQTAPSFGSYGYGGGFGYGYGGYGYGGGETSSDSWLLDCDEVIDHLSVLLLANTYPRRCRHVQWRVAGSERPGAYQRDRARAAARRPHSATNRHPASARQRPG